MLNILQSIPASTYMTLGLVILAVTMIRRARKYYQQKVLPRESPKHGEPPQVYTEHSRKRGLPRAVVKTAPAEARFAGETVPPHVAQWEVRIHELGRQTLAQMNTKLAALQVMLHEVKRAGDRAESLLAALEQRAVPFQQPIAHQEITATSSPQPSIVTETLPEPSPVPITPPSALDSAEELNALADTSVELDSFRGVLEEFEQEQADWEAEIANLQAMSDYAQTAAPAEPPLSPSPSASEVPGESFVESPAQYRDTVGTASILRPFAPGVAGSRTANASTRLPQLPEVADLPLPREIESATQTILPPVAQPIRHPSPAAPRERQAPPTPSRVAPTAGPPHEPPQFASLFEQEYHAPVAATASAAAPGNNRQLDWRQRVFLLADYGYAAGEIAEQLDRPIDEIRQTLNMRSPTAARR